MKFGGKMVVQKKIIHCGIPILSVRQAIKKNITLLKG